MLRFKIPPLSIKAAMLIGLGYGIPIVAIGLYPLGVGILVLIESQNSGEAGFYGAGFVLIGGVSIAVGLLLLGIDLGLLWGMNGQSVVAWFMTLALLGLGLWLDVPNIWGKPWWVGLNAQWFISVGGVPHDFNYWWHWLSIMASADVHLGLTACMLALLLWPSTLTWFFGRDDPRARLPWRLGKRG